MLEVKDLHVGYGETEIVKGVTFAANAGQIIGILGRNGCGKTTLLRGIAGTNRNARGEVLVHGVNILPMKPKKRACEVSMLTQHTELMAGISVREVIAMGQNPQLGILESANAQIIEQAAETVGVSGLLSRELAVLSEGQKQLVHLARVFSQNTPVILLDEPNSALDFENTHALFSRIRGMVQEHQKTAVSVLHDPNLALSYCDCIYLMEQGRFVGCVYPCTDSAEDIQKAMRLLFSRISVKGNKKDEGFYCTIA